MFGHGSFITKNFRYIYNPRPTEIAGNLIKFTADDLKGEYRDVKYSDTEPAYQFDMPPEELE